MYSLLFRSRWVALLWVGLMVGYAVFMTSGPSLLSFVSPPATPAKDAKTLREERDNAKFEAWAEEGEKTSSRTEYDSEGATRDEGYSQ